jgi:hypothetical protein
MPISDPFWMENIERRVADLERHVNNLSQGVHAMAVDISKLQSDLATLEAGFKALQVQVAGLSAGAVTQAQIDAMDKTITDTLAATAPATPAKK